MIGSSGIVSVLKLAFQSVPTASELAKQPKARLRCQQAKIDVPQNNTAAGPPNTNAFEGNTDRKSCRSAALANGMVSILNNILAHGWVECPGRKKYVANRSTSQGASDF